VGDRIRIQDPEPVKNCRIQILRKGPTPNLEPAPQHCIKPKKTSNKLNLTFFRYYVGENPLFPKDIWNKHANVLQGLQLTNNTCEVYYLLKIIFIFEFKR
jgi:hypothetical protein